MGRVAFVPRWPDGGEFVYHRCRSRRRRSRRRHITTTTYYPAAGQSVRLWRLCHACGARNRALPRMSLPAQPASSSTGRAADKEGCGRPWTDNNNKLAHVHRHAAGRDDPLKENGPSMSRGGSGRGAGERTGRKLGATPLPGLISGRLFGLVPAKEGMEVWKSVCIVIMHLAC